MIRGVLLDSGHTLVRPLGGTWWHPRIFRVALERMRLPADQVFFVDDWPNCVRGAVEVGMHGAVIERDEKRPDPELEHAPDMRSIWNLIRRRCGSAVVSCASLPR